MPYPVLEQMIRTYMATYQPQYVFGWQGGEPTLMGLEFFTRVTDLQQIHGRPGALVSNGLQTNATLLSDALAEHLARFNFLCGVSLDGPAEIHNANRRTADGRETHAQVLRGIEILRRHGVEFNVLTLVTRTNVSRPVEIYRYLRDAGFFFQQYIECVEFEPDGRLVPYAIRGEEWGDFLCAIFDEWYASDTRRVSIRLFDSILRMMTTGAANLCQMGRDCRQYFVVEYNGDVYPCDFFVARNLRLGNIMENSWEEILASPIYTAFGARKSEWDSACQQCEFLGFCGGDCPKNRSPAAREPSRRSVLCAGWRRFYTHALPRLKKLAAEIRREQTRTTIAASLTGGDTGRQAPGRNDPCPCGSGRKFKRCCGRELGPEEWEILGLSGGHGRINLSQWG